MKRLLLFLLALLLAPVLGMSFSYAVTYERQNERELFLFWQDGTARCSGLHRPYSTVRLSTEEKVVWEGKSDGRGSFECILSADHIDSQKIIKFTLRAFDQFGTEIRTPSGTSDELTAILLPRRDPALDDASTLPLPETDETPAAQPALHEQNPSPAELHASAAEKETADQSWPLFVVILLSISGGGGVILGVFFLWKKYHVVS